MSVVVDVERHVIATERLYLTADRSRVVAAGDPEAAVLFATPGKRIDRDEAERLGLLDAEPESDEGPDREPQSVDAADNDVEPDPVPEAEPKPKRSRRR